MTALRTRGRTRTTTTATTIQKHHDDARPRKLIANRPATTAANDESVLENEPQPRRLGTKKIRQVHQLIKLAKTQHGHDQEAAH
jgi:hypothetical protein